MKEPTIGVLVAVLDCVDTIDAALDSVLSQMRAVEQVVVVDGGSTDGTLDRLASRDNIEVHRQRGEGLASARNEGISILGTDLIAFCDADDRWLPNSIQCRSDYLRRNKDCGAVAGRAVTRTIDGHTIPPHRLDRLGKPVNGHTPGAVLIRRSLLPVTGAFDEGLRIAADSMWLARLIRSKIRFDFIEDIVLEKGIRADSLSADVDAYSQELLVVVKESIAMGARPDSPADAAPSDGIG